MQDYNTIIGAIQMRLNKCQPDLYGSFSNRIKHS